MPDQGCATGSHSEELPEVSPATSTPKPVPAPSINAEGKEVYSSPAVKVTPSSAVTKPATVRTRPPPQEIIEEEDDLEVPVAEGSKCLRNGCRHTFVSEEVSRRNGEESNCQYHPREASVCSSFRVCHSNELL